VKAAAGGWGGNKTRRGIRFIFNLDWPYTAGGRWGHGRTSLARLHTHGKAWWPSGDSQHAENPAGSGQASGGESTASPWENSHGCRDDYSGPIRAGKIKRSSLLGVCLDMKGVVQTGGRRLVRGQQAAGR
jgi:hypothetical protein